MEQQNFFNILGIERQELVHSRFISWLLNSNSSHGLGTKPLENFLKLLQSAINEKVNSPNKDTYNELLNKIWPYKYKVENIEVYNEKDDIDITVQFELIECDKLITIYIENKVDAKEHDCQTNKYYNKHKGDNALFVYLTPLHPLKMRHLNKPECKCQQFIQINYQQLLDEVIEPAQKELSNNKDKNRDRFFINEYIINLSNTPNKKNNNDTNISNNIMAIPMEEQLKLWKEVKQEKANFAKKLYTFASLSPELQEHMDAVETIMNAITSDCKGDFIVFYDKHIYCEKSAKDTLLKVVKQIIEKTELDSVIAANNKISNKSERLITSNSENRRSIEPLEGNFHLNTDNSNSLKIKFLNHLKKNLDLDLQVFE